MSGHANEVIEEVEFTDALRLHLDERIRVCVLQVEQRLTSVSATSRKFRNFSPTR